jgi:hypothetical protein
MTPSLVQPINFERIYGSVQRGSGGFAHGGSIQIPVEDSKVLLAQTMIYKEDIIGNALGAYSIATNIKSGTAHWAKINPVKFITRARPTDCSRTAESVGTATAASKALDKCHLFLKFCKDTFAASLDSTWQSLWGKGNELNDINATEAGREVFTRFMGEVLNGVGNDFSTNAWWGQHPYIATTIAANPLTLSAGLIEDIEDTVAVTAGILKQIDALKDASHPNLNNTISSGDVSGYAFTGDAIQLMADVKSKARPKFAQAMSSLKARHNYPIAYVTPGIFNRLREQIVTANPGLASTLLLQLNGNVTAELGIEMVNLTSYDSFVWDGVQIVNRPDWEGFASEVGFWHHRVLMFVPQVAIGFAIDVEESSQFDGMGLIVTKSSNPEHGGAYFVEANYQMAAAILDHEYIVNYNYQVYQS